MLRQNSRNGVAPGQLNNVITIWGNNFDDVVDYAYATGLFTTRSQAEEHMTKQRRDYILMNHDYPIWETEDRGKTVFRSKVPQDDKRPKKIQSTSKEELEEKIIQFYIDQKKAEEKNQLTLRTLWPEWISFKSSSHPKSTIDRNTVSWNKYYLNDADSQTMLDTPLIQIDNVELEKYMFHMIKKYKMNRHTYGDFSVIIRQMLDYAYRRKMYIPTNPMDFVVIKNSNLKDERKRKPKEKIFFDDDIQQIVDYAWEQYHKGRSYVQRFVPLAIIFMLYTGIRVGEVTAIRFDDIEDELLYIWQSFAKESNEIQQKVKKEEAREVDLIPEAIKVVEEVKAKRIELGLPVDGFIFPVNDCYMSLYKSVYKMIRKYCEELGLNYHTSHDTRRTFVSQLHKNGCPAATIMRMTGHRDYKTFEKSYLFDAEEHEATKNYIRKALVK